LLGFRNATEYGKYLRTEPNLTRFSIVSSTAILSSEDDEASDADVLSLGSDKIEGLSDTFTGKSTTTPASTPAATSGSLTLVAPSDTTLALDPAKAC
jgi:hypothetical protein